MAYKTLNLFLIALFTLVRVNAQSYYSTGTGVFGGYNHVEYDTLEVSGLDSLVLNGDFGLDSVTLNIHCNHTSDLVISLIAPDGTLIHLSEQQGGYNGAHFTGTCFDMDADYIIDELQAPFTGKMIPSNSIAQVNNGQNGNGTWQLRVLNKGTGWGIQVLDWGLHFNNTPALYLLDSTSLPIVVINTNNETMSWLYWFPDAGMKIDGTMGIVYNGPGVMNYRHDSTAHFSGNIKIGIRGTSSAYFPQKSYSIDTKTPDGLDTNVSLLGMPAEKDWVLYAPWCDKSMMRNVLSYQLWRELGRPGPRTRYCELILNGDYKGIYVLMENIKRGINRVPVSKLEAHDTSEIDITGGYILEVDKGGIPDSQSFASNYLPCTNAATGITFEYVYPKPENILPVQKQYIRSYIDSFENALANISYYDLVNGYRHYIDALSFMDFSIMQELANNVDAYRLSSYMYKPRNHPLMAGPLWDLNLAYGNAYYYVSWGIDNFRWDLPCPFTDPYLNPSWWKTFQQDTSFVREFRCRYSELRSGVLSNVHINGIIDSLTGILDVPSQRHYQRWPIIGRYIPPNIYIGSSWEDEVSYLSDWISERSQFLDSAWYDPCYPTGAENLTRSISLNIYPNPASEKLYVVSAEKISRLSLYNSIGQEVVNEDCGLYKASLDVSSLTPGIYLLDVYSGKAITRKKVALIK